jgi:hypothetical protein
MPYSKFFWSDWDADPALRMVSMAAQGFWMRMLCIASNSDPIGYVMLNGRGLDEDDLAHLTGQDKRKVKGWVKELEEAGVFSRDERGVIYSRRMTRDFLQLEQARQWGQTGGNPALKKGAGNSQHSERAAQSGRVKGGLNGGNKAPLKAGVKGEGYPPMVKPESRIQKPEARKNPDNQSVSLSAAPRGGELVTHIAEAAGLGDYSAWPQGLKNLQPIYDMLERQGVSLELFLSTVHRLRGQGRTYGTWDYVRQVLLNEPAQAPAPAPTVEDEAKWRWRLEKARERQEWCSEAWGPMPYADGCRVPEHLWADDDANGWRDVPDKAE